jgi:hypothetical protein
MTLAAVGVGVPVTVVVVRMLRYLFIHPMCYANLILGPTTKREGRKELRSESIAI